MATHAPITVYKALNEIYPSESLLHQGERWNALTSSFQSEFNQAATHVVRAPGRINLIGEHIDYCLFGVMPAAVEMDCLIALSSTTQEDAASSACKMTIANLDPSWPGSTIEAVRSGTDKRWTVQGGSGQRGDWTAYLGSALDCILNVYFKDSSRTPTSLNLMITGSIPPGSGLSSSAALIVASLLAILLGNDLTGKMVEGEDRPLISNADLVQLARQAEAQIGVNSGGMDQSASVLSKQGSGLYVSFTPALGVESVQLPVIWKDGVPSDSLVMVIANSLTKHDLAHGATKQYNLRVMETLVGARILGQALGIVDDNESERIQLREVAGRYAGEPKLRDLTDETALTTDKLEQAIQSILVKVDEILGPDSDLRHLGHLPEGLPKLCGMSDQDFRRIYLDFIKIDTSDQGGRLCLYKRVTHVFSEALRVLQVMKACRSQELNAEEDGVKLVGRLMNESHESCRDLYECSNEQLDELVSVCRKAGSIGSRLSGAGWGGCAVSLVPASREKEFIATITSRTNGYSAYKDMQQDELKNTVFKTVPGSGAGVMWMQ